METFNIAEDDYSARIKRCFYLAVWGAFNIAEECGGAYKEPSNGILLAMSHLNTTQYLMRMASRYFIFYCALWFHGKCLLLFTLFISLLVESWYSCLLCLFEHSCLLCLFLCSWSRGTLVYSLAAHNRVASHGKCFCSWL